jgi:hypothetical protein
VKVGPQLFADYDFTSRQAANHRGQIREFHDFRKATVGDEDKLTVWLAADICPLENSRDRLRSALLVRCRQERIEPPAAGQVERVLGEAESLFDRHFTLTTRDRLPDGAADKLEELLEGEDPDSVGGRHPSTRAPGGRSAPSRRALVRRRAPLPPLPQITGPLHVAARRRRRRS